MKKSMFPLQRLFNRFTNIFAVFYAIPYLIFHNAIIAICMVLLYYSIVLFAFTVYEGLVKNCFYVCIYSGEEIKDMVLVNARHEGDVLKKVYHSYNGKDDNPVIYRQGAYLINPQWQLSIERRPNIIY